MGRMGERSTFRRAEVVYERGSREHVCMRQLPGLNGKDLDDLAHSLFLYPAMTDRD